MEKARLVVIEGPDNTGKTSLAQGLAAAFSAAGIPVDYMSFPGREVASIGSVIYQIEHFPEKFGLTQIDPAARQVLHLAAHLDAIVNRIKPALASGRWIMLDRFWWSMWAYGTAQGLSAGMLSKLVSIEQDAWGALSPRVIFTTLRPLPFTEKSSENWDSVSKAYLTLANQQNDRQKIIPVAPDSRLEERVKYCLEILKSDGDLW